MDNAERYVTRWQTAGLLDSQTATAIRAYEQAQQKPAGRQWQVLVALILGGILLGAGVLLFVAAHWENVSPLVRTLMVLSMLVFFHGLGLLVHNRFSGFATAMHALGTVSAGAAIALVGQIFNMQEHWPAAVFLVAWGVRISAKALVNYGMAVFASTVIWFYFSSVMDKLDRSLGLIQLALSSEAGFQLLHLD
jgi:uncharacterized membrane protein